MQDLMTTSSITNSNLLEQYACTLASLILAAKMAIISLQGWTEQINL